MKAPICPYCGEESKLVTGAVLYCTTRADLVDKQFWRCVPCDAHVGCHRGTTNPLGRLADLTLRMWKGRAHAAFDGHWKGFETAQQRRAARTAAYARLAADLGIEAKDCHIGMFDRAGCERTIQICITWNNNNHITEAP